MKDLNLKRGGTKSALLIALAVVITLLAGVFTSAYALNDGDTIHYTSTRNGDSSYGLNFKSGDYEGTCADADGPPEKSSGTATIRMLKRTNERDAKWYKIAYFYDIEKSWLHNQNTFPGAGTSVYSSIYMGMMQWAEVEGDPVAEERVLSTWRAEGTSDRKINKVLENYAEAISKNIDDIPQGFEIMRCSTPDHSAQDFILYRMVPSGKLKLRKTSQNESITG